MIDNENVKLNCRKPKAKKLAWCTANFFAVFTKFDKSLMFIPTKKSRMQSNNLVQGKATKKLNYVTILYIFNFIYAQCFGRSVFLSTIHKQWAEWLKIKLIILEHLNF